MDVDALDQIRRERDFYLRLLALGAQSEPEPFLREALSLVVGLTSTRRGYLEIRDERDGAEGSAWWLAHGCSESDVDQIRSNISRGIVAEAIATGETIVTDSAMLDERFMSRTSVQAGKIEAVLCAPIGGRAALGVVYLQNREQGGRFSDADRANAEMFAAHVAPLADRLFARRRLEERDDATRELRARHRLEGIVGRSAALADALRQAMLAAPLDVNVLITGASGTGKTQLARAIHANSPRAAGPFVEINCGAIPADLVESELFGAGKGAFTGADRDRAGKVAAAEKGTLLLDEIGELPYAQQAKLLQLLQSRSYSPLGSNAPVSADVRVIAATNADLEAAVRERRFREDLFFRLQVLPVRMPSLRERRSDLPDLAVALLAAVCERHRLPALALSRGALAAIESADWPGNVRQLENAVEAAAIRAAGGGASEVEAAHVFPGAEPDRGRADGTPLTFQEETRHFQRRLLERTLEECEWNVTEAARRLDLSRAHAYNLIQAFGLKRKS
jgi:Nif-specific regulatory protein